VGCEILHQPGDFGALEPAWSRLCAVVGDDGEDAPRGLVGLGAGLFLSHDWLTSWWRAYHGVDQLWVMAVREGERLVGGLPLSLSPPRSGQLKVSELRMIGDLGGTQQSLLCSDADLDLVCRALAGRLRDTRGWDVLDLPVRGRLAERLEAAFIEAGLKARRTEVAGRAALELPMVTDWEEFARPRRATRTLPGAQFVVERDARVGLEELLRVCKKEWAAREEAGPAADVQTVAFLSDVAPRLCAAGQARFGLLRSDGGRVVAADFVVRQKDGYVQLLRGVDPEVGALAELGLWTTHAAVVDVGRRFAFATSAHPESEIDDDEPQRLRATIRKGQRLRAWSGTTRSRLHRGVSSLSGVVKSMDQVLLDQLRGKAPDVVARAVAKVASYTTLHLYRGELFTRDVVSTPDLLLSLLSQDTFLAMSDAAREELLARLELSAPYCAQKWERRDLVVLAEIVDGTGRRRAAGIVWCARAPVYVPDIAREVKPLAGECYIHDVFVHPDQRGRQITPAMLDFLARELRGRDIYRAWALIERSNTPSTRAFEKAAYAAVADVVYARVGLSSRLMVRPPDPEARAFLGV